jgi:hypothetical protein
MLSVLTKAAGCRRFVKLRGGMMSEADVHLLFRRSSYWQVMSCGYDGRQFTQ